MNGDNYCFDRKNSKNCENNSDLIVAFGLVVEALLAVVVVEMVVVVVILEVLFDVVEHVEYGDCRWIDAERNDDANCGNGMSFDVNYDGGGGGVNAWQPLRET